MAENLKFVRMANTFVFSVKTGCSAVWKAARRSSYVNVSMSFSFERRMQSGSSSVSVG